MKRKKTPAIPPLPLSCSDRVCKKNRQAQGVRVRACVRVLKQPIFVYTQKKGQPQAGLLITFEGKPEVLQD